MMKYLKLFEDIDFDDEDWEEEDIENDMVEKIDNLVEYLNDFTRWANVTKIKSSKINNNTFDDLPPYLRAVLPIKKLADKFYTPHKTLDTIYDSLSNISIYTVRVRVTTHHGRREINAGDMVFGLIKIRDDFYIKTFYRPVGFNKDINTSIHPIDDSNNYKKIMMNKIRDILYDETRDPRPR